MTISGEKIWIEVEKEKLAQNIREIKKHLGPTIEMMAVVKSNAYGHGMEGVSALCVQEGITWFGVDSIDEAMMLRRSGIKTPLLILGYVPLTRLAETVQEGIDVTVYNNETIERLNEEASRYKKEIFVHLKVETGTSRQGREGAELLELARAIQASEYIRLRGISTHFANIEDTTDHSYAEEQLRRFQLAGEVLEKEGIDIPLRHAACSAAGILFPETHFNLARFGISLYGEWSSGETHVSAQAKGMNLRLTPCLTWKTRVAQVKRIKTGTPVSYGLTEKVNRDSIIAVLPVGYFDGYDRSLSSIGTVLIRGTHCKVLGRVCMNMMMVDVTHLPDLRVEEEVVLLGRQGKEEITAQELAKKANTVHYEILARLNPFTRRFYV